MTKELCARIETLVDYSQVLDLSLEDCVEWLETKVSVLSQDGYGYLSFHGPVVSFDVAGEDYKYAKFWLFEEDNEFYKTGSIESAIKSAIWKEVQVRIKSEQSAYAWETAWANR